MFAAEDIKRRITSMRTLLTRIKNKEKKGKSGSAGIKLTPREIFFKNRLSFLNVHLRVRKTYSTLNEV